MTPPPVLRLSIDAREGTYTTTLTHCPHHDIYYTGPCPDCPDPWAQSAPSGPRCQDCVHCPHGSAPPGWDCPHACEPAVCHTGTPCEVGSA